MKKTILALAMVMSLGTVQHSVASSAPKHRYVPATEQKAEKKNAADTKVAKNTDDEAIEAYSDTTDVDSDYDEEAATDANSSPSYHSHYSLGQYDDPFDYFGSVFGGGILGFFVTVLLITSLVFLFAPFIVIFFIFRYLYRRHNDKMKLMEKAIENGVNIPESSMPLDKQNNEYLVKHGLKNAFLGIGLCVMFLIMGSSSLAGIGALLFFYGLGKATIGSLPDIKSWWSKRHA